MAPITNWYSMTYTSEVPTWGRTFLNADPEEPGTRIHTRSPVLNARNARTPCLIVAGGRDRCTPPDQARELHRALRANGVESMLAIYPLEGHGVRSFPAVLDFLTRVVCWFGRHLPA